MRKSIFRKYGVLNQIQWSFDASSCKCVDAGGPKTFGKDCYAMSQRAVDKSSHPVFSFFFFDYLTHILTQGLDVSVHTSCLLASKTQLRLALALICSSSLHVRTCWTSSSSPRLVDWCISADLHRHLALKTSYLYVHTLTMWTFLQCSFCL